MEIERVTEVTEYQCPRCDRKVDHLEHGYAGYTNEMVCHRCASYTYHMEEAAAGLL